MIICVNFSYGAGGALEKLGGVGGSQCLFLLIMLILWGGGHAFFGH